MGGRIAGRVHRTLRGHATSVSGVGFHPDGKRLVLRSKDGLVQLWDWEAGFELLTLPVPSGDIVWHAVFSPDGKTIAAARRGQRYVSLWRVDEARESSILMNNMNILGDRSPESRVDAAIEMTDLTVLGTAVLYELAVELATRENLACFETCTKVKCPHACPPVMVPLLVYCYAAGIYGSREIEELSCKEQNLKRVCGDKWLQTSQIRCFRREHQGLLQRCLTGLIYEARARSGPKPEAWACELEAGARIRLAIRLDSMELDA